jgi:hypothetical protein
VSEGLPLAISNKLLIQLHTWSQFCEVLNLETLRRSLIRRPYNDASAAKLTYSIERELNFVSPETRSPDKYFPTFQEYRFNRY